MKIKKNYQYILDNYKVDETLAADIWKKAHWYAVFHPVSLLSLLCGLLFKYLIFHEKNDVLLYGIVSIQNLYAALIILMYITLCHMYRLKYIKRNLIDKCK